MTLATRDTQQALERLLAMQETLDRLLLREEVEQFLYSEAALLDERRYSDWLNLIADDIHYFMPIRRNVKFGDFARENSNPEFEIAWYDEDKKTLDSRVRQLNTGVHWAEEPASRIRRIVSNVQVTEVQGDAVQVRCCFFLYQQRLQYEVNVFVGKREDVLRRDPETGWKIAKRTILLDQNVFLAKNFNTFF